MLCKVRVSAVMFVDAPTAEDACDAMAAHLREELDMRDITVEPVEREDAAGWPVKFVGANNEAERRVSPSAPAPGGTDGR